MSKVTKDSWETLPIPEQHHELNFDAEFTSDEFAKLARGFKPREMEDKWFIYMEENTLYFHRSWTGFCIFVVDFAQVLSDKYKVSRVLVNRDTDQYTEMHDALDIILIQDLFHFILKYN